MSLLPMPDLKHAIRRSPALRVSGRVLRVAGLLVEGSIPGAHLGMVCQLQLPGGDARDAVPAEVVALQSRSVSLMPLGGVQGIRSGTLIHTTGEQPLVAVGPGLLGRVLDGWGTPLDAHGAVDPRDQTYYPLDPKPLNPLERSMITRPLAVGVRSIDALLACGQGQRLAIMAGAGVITSAVRSTPQLAAPCRVRRSGLRVCHAPSAGMIQMTTTFSNRARSARRWNGAVP